VHQFPCLPIFFATPDNVGLTSTVDVCLISLLSGNSFFCCFEMKRCCMIKTNLTTLFWLLF